MRRCGRGRRNRGRQAAQAVRARIYTQRIELPDDAQLVTELGRLRTKYRAGSATIEIPKVGDSHCDVAVALMAAVGELDRGGVGGVSEAWLKREPSYERAFFAGIDRVAGESSLEPRLTSAGPAPAPEPGGRVADDGWPTRRARRSGSEGESLIDKVF